MRTTILARVSFAVLVVALHSARAERPWDTPFAKDTRAIASHAGKISVPEDQFVVILLEDHKYAIDKRGRTLSTIRKVYRVQREDAVDYWASVEQEYQPWFEETPELRARVIGPAGEVSRLDPSTISNSPTREFNSTIFSDRRAIRAPLPAIEVGSVVEYEIKIREKSPLLDAGVTRRIAVMDGNPIERFRVLIDAHKDVTLRTTSRLVPESSLRRETTKKGTRFEAELGPLEVREDVEFNLPPDTTSHPYIAFSTGESWQAVATQYAGIVDRQIEGADLTSILDGIDLTGPADTVAGRLTAKLHREIRYTGVEFGEAEIVPRPPAQTLQRKYGDCKDKSALLVAMLRAAGLASHLALLSSGYGLDVDRELPGMGQFNHAIVYVESDPPLWIDATAENTRVSVLPTIDQGRFALVAAPESTHLVTTPAAAAASNWQRHTIAARLSEYGPGEFVETVEAGGTMEAALRDIYGGDHNSTEDLLKAMLNDSLAKLGEYHLINQDDTGKPFRVRVQALDAQSIFTGIHQAVARMSPSAVFEKLPFALIPDPAAGPSEDSKPRRHDFFMPEPHQMEHRYKLTPGTLYKSSSLPESVTVELGPANYTKSYTANEDGTVDVLFRFTSGKRRWAPEEVEAFKDAVGPYYRKEADEIRFMPVTTEYTATGRFGEAITLLREHLSRNQESAIAHAHFSKLLVSAGLTGAAIEEGKKATELDAESGAAWTALGWAYQHDVLGRRFQGNWDRSRAVGCYRKAVELDPGDCRTSSTPSSSLWRSRGASKNGAAMRRISTCAGIAIVCWERT